jgi:nitrilase
MKVALIQLSAGADKEENLRKAIRLVRRAIVDKCRLIVLPEVFNVRGATFSKAWKDVPESIPGPSTEPFMKLANEFGVHILCGSIFERSARSPRAYNTSAWINARGNIEAKYRKIHLFQAKLAATAIREADTFIPGRKPVCVSVEGWTFGLSICYDLRFPELYREYAARGADVLLVPSSFTYATGKVHWEALLKARAIENLSYVLAPNQSGVDGRGVRCYGHSAIISPWGETLKMAGSGREKIVTTILRKSSVDRARNILPAIGRRAAAYA